MIRFSMSLRAFNDLFPDENAARAWFEMARWPHGPECPACELVNKAAFLRNRRIWECMGCNHQFSVTAGTPMHRTHLPLLVWAQAIYLTVASSKGISAVKLSEMLDVHYSTAWHLGHRIRAMMAEANPILAGVVELDEMYAGAAPRKQAKPADDDAPPPPANTKGRGTKRPLVLVATERGGKVAAEIIPTHGKAAIAAGLEGKLALDAVVITNGLPTYRHLGADRIHLSVNHSDKEFARTDEASGLRVHVNTVESFNGFLRRAVIGVWHQISVKHLGRYASETTFRWNRRADICLARMTQMVRNGESRLLSYAFLTAKPV